MKESVFLKFKILFPLGNEDKDIKNCIYKIKENIFSDILDMYQCLFDCCTEGFNQENHDLVKTVWDNIPLKLMYYDSIYTSEGSFVNLLLKIKSVAILLNFKNNSNLYDNKLLESIYYLHWCKLQSLYIRSEDEEIETSILKEIMFLISNDCFSGKKEIERQLKIKILNRIDFSGLDKIFLQ